MSSNNQHELLEIDKFLKKSHFLKLTNDAAFKTYFKSNEEALKSLLTHFLPLPKDSKIIKVDVLDPDLHPNSPAVTKDRVWQKICSRFKSAFKENHTIRYSKNRDCKCRDANNIKILFYRSNISIFR